MNAHVVPRKTYLTIWAILMVLLFATWGVAQVNLGAFNTVVALTIAFTKMLLVILVFMNVRYSTRLTWLVAASGFVLLAIMIDLTLSDYLTRGIVRGIYPNTFELPQTPPSTQRPVQNRPGRHSDIKN
jgi:cytochrome c oxidase subunit 4